jgi:uncharacterized membrane protein
MSMPTLPKPAPASTTEPTGPRRSSAQILDRLIHPRDQLRVIEAIRRAELTTAAEIKVHVEACCPAADPHTRGVELFDKLGLHRTEARNGVLIYAATHERRFTILGDVALDASMRDELFGEALRRLSIAFRRGAFGEGIASAVTALATTLTRRFPGTPGNKNEIDNTISTEDTYRR